MKIEKGDKFRVNVVDLAGGYYNGDVFVAVQENTHGVYFYDNDGVHRFIAHDNITLVDDHGEPWDYRPALRIEAGKYYKTRDGRKVGPTRESDDYMVDPYPFRCGDWYVTKNGTVNLGMGFDENSDLIAEWVDEPASEPAKFKVGDRVRLTGCAGLAKAGATGIVGPRGIYNSAISDAVYLDIVWERNALADDQMDGEYHIGMFEPLAEQSVDSDAPIRLEVGKLFFTGNTFWVDDPKAAEPDSTLSVKITADTTELDAEIDRIKRRLKKLAKKARKLGVSLDYDLVA